MRYNRDSRRNFLKLASGTGAALLLCPGQLIAGYDPCWQPGRIPANPIDISVFEMFKIGPGPSSSHTIAPMKAGNDFLSLANALPPQILATADKITVRLYGSLSATGKGHGTDKAVAAGLLGQAPETCTAAFLDALFARPEEKRQVALDAARVPLGLSDIVFEKEAIQAPFSNVLTIALQSGEQTLVQREYYSVGGGFLQWKGWVQPERGKPRHLFDSMNGLLELSRADRPAPAPHYAGKRNGRYRQNGKGNSGRSGRSGGRHG